MEVKNKHIQTTVKPVFYLALFILFMFISFSRSSLHAQGPVFSFGSWHFNNFSGLIELSAFSNSENVNRKFQQNTINRSQLGVRFLLNSNSYVWHPNFLDLNLLFEYNPALFQEKNFLTFERNENRDSEQFRVDATFFKQKMLSVNAYANLARQNLNREFLTDVNSIRYSYGTRLSFKNPIAPLNISFNGFDGYQKEVQTGREFYEKRKILNFEFKATLKSMADFKLGVNFGDYEFDYGTVLPTHNRLSRFYIKGNIFFNKEKSNKLNSMLRVDNQAGSQPYTRTLINENLKWKFPANFDLSGNFSYNHYQYNLTRLETRQYKFLPKLNHKLYKSLFSQIYYEYNKYEVATFKGVKNIYGFRFDYRKNIPAGRLNLTWEYRHTNESDRSLTNILHIVNEEHILDEAVIVLLDYPNVDLSTIIVKDENNNIQYTENIDYILFERNYFVEIQRLPGGQIINGSTVLVDYYASTPPEVNYSFVNNSLSFRITLLNNIFSVYTRIFNQDFQNSIFLQGIVIKNIAQRVLGAQIKMGGVITGFEIDDYDSNIIPYYSKRLFFSFNNRAGKYFSVLLNGGLQEQDYKFSNLKNRFADAKVGVTFWLSRLATLKLNGGYRFQEGYQMDLKLDSYKIEYSQQYHQIFLRAGFEKYGRKFLSEKIDYEGFYVRVERRF